MKALYFYDIDDLRMEEKSIPTPKEEEILLKVASVGICGSDVHYYQEGGTGGLHSNRPLVLGHEFSAIIAEGSNRGKLVAVDPALPCGKCEYCLEGNPNFCTDLQFAGAEETDGALQEFVAWNKNALFILPESFTPQEAALLEPLGVAIHALRLAPVFPGMNVGVFGVGSIGLLSIQLARLAGATRIFATDRLSHRLALAREFGATDIFLADGNEAEKVLSATSGRGVDIAFEAAGDDGTAVDTAIKASKRGGNVVLIGIPSEDETRFTASAARRRGITIKLSRRMKNTYPTAIRLVSQRQIDLKPLITHEFPFHEYNKAFDTARDRKGVKVVINLE